MNHLKTAIGRGAVAPVLLFAMFALSACTGGGTNVAGGGTGGTGISTGAITGFGSVIVNGVHYLTNVSTVRKRLDEGSAGISGEDNVVFRRGMVVRVRFNVEDNTASEIDFQDTLKGPVSSVTTSDNSFLVFGVNVVVDNGTFYYDNTSASPPLSSLAGLSIGNVVEVSGLVDNTGTLHATLVEREALAAPASPEYEIKGYVTGLTSTQFTLALAKGASGGVTVAYGGGTPLDGLPGGLADNLFVEVHASSDAAPVAATKIEGKSEAAQGAQEGWTVDAEGYPVGAVKGNPAGTYGAFTLDGISVSTSGSTTYSDGRGMGRSGFMDVMASPAPKLEVEGTIIGGVLSAVTITFK